MSSTEELTQEEQRLLLDVAAQSIRHGLRHGAPLGVSAPDYPPRLRALRCTFVTLERRGSLRGCIGALIAEKPLVEDVAWHAFAAAFEDPRFPPLMERELEDLGIEISILNPPMPFPVQSEEELLRQLRPHQDGLILKEGWRRATFLPSVWDSLPEPREFLAHLKMKAGLSPGYWSDALTFERYTTTSFGTEETGENTRTATG